MRRPSGVGYLPAIGRKKKIWKQIKKKDPHKPTPKRQLMRVYPPKQSQRATYPGLKIWVSAIRILLLIADALEGVDDVLGELRRNGALLGSVPDH